MRPRFGRNALAATICCRRLTTPTSSSSAASRGTGLGVLLLIGAAVLWSVSGVAVKRAQVDPIVFTTLRSLGAALTLAPLLPLGRRLTGRAWPAPRLAVGLGLVHTVMVASFIAATTWASAAEGILLQYSAPAWVALIGWLALGRRVDRPTLVALLIASAGVLIMLADSILGAGAVSPIGPLLGLIAGLGYAGVILGLDAVDADATRRTGGPANVFAVVCINNTLSGLILLPWAWSRGLGDLAGGAIAFILAVGAIQMAVPYILFQLGLRRVGPVAAGLLSLAEPILNPVWVWLDVGEAPPPSAFAGGSLVLLAVVITAVLGRRRGARSRAAVADDLALPAQ